MYPRMATGRTKRPSGLFCTGQMAAVRQAVADGFQNLLRAVISPAVIFVIAAMGQGMIRFGAVEAAPRELPTPSAPEAAKPTLAETTVRPAIEKASTLREEGKHEEALDALRVATREVKKAAGESAPELLPIYELAADILVETAQTEKATVLLEKAIELHRTLLAESRHPDPACYGRTLLVEHRHHAAERRIEPALDAAKRAWLLLDVHAGPSADDTQRAAEAFAQSLGTFHELLGPDHDATLAASEVAAAVHEGTGRLDQAIALRRQLAGQALKRHGPTAPATLAAADHVTRLLHASGRAGEAIEAQESVVAGAEGSSVAAAHRLQGDLLRSLERFTEAEAAYRAALEADLAAVGEAHPATALDRLSLERVRILRGRALRDDVLESSSAALSQPADEKSEPTAVLVAALLEAADLHAHRGDEERAREYGRRALQAADALETVAADLRVAALVAAGRTSSAAPKTAARDALEKALAAADEQLGSGHPATHEAVVTLAEAALGAGDVEAAHALVARLLDRSPPRPDGLFEERLVALVDRTATAVGDDGAALRDRLIAVRETQFGAEHGHTAHVLVLFGGTRLAAGDATTAAAYGRRALDIQSKSVREDHPDLAATLMVVAEALRAGGQVEQARPLFERALVIWERAAGDEHPVTLTTRRGLARTALATGDTAAALPHLERLRAAATATPSTAALATEPADPIAHLRLLVRLGGILAEAGERDRARQIVVESLALSCWQPAPYAEADVFESLAVSMAEIARIFKALEEPASSTEALRRARGYATRVASPKELLARVDATLEREGLVGDDL